MTSIDRTDAAAGILFILFALFFGLQSLGLELGTAFRMGPGYFPLVLSAVLLGFGLLILFNALILVSWARYQQRKGRKFAQRRAEANALSDKNLSESFKLGEGDLEQLRKPGVLVIHNDEEGGVEEVKSHVSRDVEKPTLTLVPGQDRGKDAS